MTREAAISVLRNNIVATIPNSDTIITVINVVAVDSDVCAANADAVSVSGKGHGLVSGAIARNCVDKMVTDLNVGPGNAKTPSDGLDDLDVGDLAIGQVEHCNSRSVSLSIR